MKNSLKKLFKALIYAFKRNPYYDQKMLLSAKNKVTIFDIGAHHSQTALKYNQIFNNCNIYSFEPFTESFNVLNKKVKAYNNIRTFNTALSNETGEVDFHVNKYLDTNSILLTHSEAENIWGADILDTLKTIKVGSTTVDDFTEKMGVNQIDILKIDTQGTEYSILEGAKKTLNKIR